MGTLTLVVEIAGSGVFAAGLAASWVSAVRSGARRERGALQEHARARRARLAAVEAGEDDPAFAPEAIEQAVTEVLALAEKLWRREEPGAANDRPDASLVRAWARWWQARLGGDLEMVGKPTVDLLQIANRADRDEGRVVARVRLRVHCPNAPLIDHRVRIDERWTLGRGDPHLVLLSVDGDPFAKSVLTAPLIPTPSFDTGRLREESLAEMAHDQKVGGGVALSDLVNADEPPDLALLDLSNMDGRFLPALIASELAHLVEAWEGAVTGSEAPLSELADASAREALLRPGGGTRLIVQDAVLKSWKATTLDLARKPPAIEVALDVEAVRYVVGSNGERRAGNAKDVHPMALTWLLELTDTTSTPWRLVKSSAPAKSIPGWA